MDLRELQRQRWQADHQRSASPPPAERPADPAGEIVGDVRVSTLRKVVEEGLGGTLHIQVEL